MKHRIVTLGCILDRNCILQLQNCNYNVGALRTLLENAKFELTIMPTLRAIFISTWNWLEINVFRPLHWLLHLHCFLSFWLSTRYSSGLYNAMYAWAASSGRMSGSDLETIVALQMPDPTAVYTSYTVGWLSTDVGRY